ncbi:Homeodomain-like domain-containing protein [Bradyrhizobium shewense]|uniref:Homeodomain-like domain-containing protein n=1 Tax=Bradyrhizobium shewense TaxID=1761772 RepID=A0A1C3XTY3_9BRAD|nr:Homeodomain-like domain-containing protein [Bradyrhizobium shewense]
MLGGGEHAARKLKWAQILLAGDAGSYDAEIVRTVRVSPSTVGRTKRRFVEGNLERALSEEPRPGAERKLTGKEEALLVATACAKPPVGRKRWTLTLLADAMVKLTDHDSLSGETARRQLAENNLKPWRRDMWCIHNVNGEYVARMEDVLDLYAETPDPDRPLVCFDETPVQLIGEVRQPVPAQPGQRERYDYEYRRNGTVNLFVTFDPHRGRRNIKVTERRAAADYAHCMREFVDVHYPDAACIRVVHDNLSIHTAGALYHAFAPAEARRILRRLEFHYTPNTPAGSTWSSARSACSSASVSAAASTTPKGSEKRSQHRNGSEIKRETASNGCSQPTKHEPNSAAPIRSPPKSQNQCDEPLGLGARKDHNGNQL